MSVIIYSESENGKFKKSAFELASYGRALADKLGLSLIAISINNNNVDPISNFGVDKFLNLCKESGVDGLIIVDLPFEHDDELCLPAKKAGIDFIRLIAPTTNEERIPYLLDQSSGFVYCISLSGITGSKEAKTKIVNETIDRIKKFSELPIAVGFGIKTPKQAGEMALKADATVIGSIIIEKINEIYSSKMNNETQLNQVYDFIDLFSKEIHKL